MEAWEAFEPTATRWLEYNLRLDKAREQGNEEYRKTYEEIKEEMLGNIVRREAIMLMVSGVLTFEDISEFTGYPTETLIQMKSEIMAKV